MICPAEPNRLEIFIECLARRIAGLHRDSYAGADDLAQEGRIALLRAKRNWQPDLGAFEAYAKTTIQREMYAAVLAGKGIFSGPLKIKRMGVRARAMRSDGKPDREIARALGLPISAIVPITRLVTPASSEGIE